MRANSVIPLLSCGHKGVKEVEGVEEVIEKAFLELILP